MARSNRWKNNFFVHWMCTGWWSNCWPFCHPYPHSPYDGYNPSQFVALWLFLPHSRNYLPLGHCEYSSICKCLSCPTTVLLSSQLWFLHTCLPFSVWLSSMLGLMACLSCSAWQCHSSQSVSLPSHQIIQGKERNWPFIICGHIFLSSLSVLSLSHGLLSCAVLCAVCPSPGILSCPTCSQLSHKVWKFYCQNTCISLVCAVWKSPSLWRKQ